MFDFQQPDVYKKARGFQIEIQHFILQPSHYLV